MITLRDLSAKDVRHMVDKLMQPQVRGAEIVIDGDTNTHEQTRRDHLRERYLVMTDCYDGLMNKWVTEVYREPAIIEEIQRHILPLFNPPRRAVDRLAVVYTHKPVRRIAGRKTDTKKWKKILDASLYDKRMAQVNRDQVAYNTAVVLPLPRKTDDGEIVFDFDVVTGAQAEVINGPGRSDFGAPDILFQRFAQYAHDDAGRPVVRAIDSEFVVWFNSSGELLPDMTERHGLGFFPGATVRNTIPSGCMDPDDNYWDPWVNKGAFRAMRSVARIVASMDWTRKTQCRKLIAELIDDESKDDGAIDEQVMGDAEGVLKLRGEAIRLAVHDLDVAVKNFAEHIHLLQDEALEVMTGAVASLGDPKVENPLEGAAAARSHAAVELHRMSQIDFLRPVDLRNQRIMAAILRRMGQETVDPEMLREKSEVEYQPLPFVDDVTNRLNWYVLASKFGIADEVMAAIDFHGWTEDEALEKLKAMQERKAELNEIKTRTNTPNDPTHVDDGMVGEGLPEQQGRAGGQRTSPPSAAEASRAEQ